VERSDLFAPTLRRCDKVGSGWSYRAGLIDLVPRQICEHLSRRVAKWDPRRASRSQTRCRDDAASRQVLRPMKKPCSVLVQLLRTGRMLEREVRFVERQQGGLSEEMHCRRRIRRTVMRGRARACLPRCVRPPRPMSVSARSPRGSGRSGVPTRLSRPPPAVRLLMPVVSCGNSGSGGVVVCRYSQVRPAAQQPWSFASVRGQMYRTTVPRVLAPACTRCFLGSVLAAVQAGARSRDDVRAKVEANALAYIIVLGRSLS